MHTEAGKSHHSHHHDNVATSGDLGTATALLKYMLEHNQHHEEELHSLVHQLGSLGQDEPAQAAEQALTLYQQGNAQLARAVEAL